MADPSVYNDVVAVAQEEAMRKVAALIGGVPEAGETFAEKYGNRSLPSSPAALVEAARDDQLVRGSHGPAIMLQALARVVAHQQEEIEELKAAMPRSRSAARR